MGNLATKFRKALINGDEGLACQLYESNPQFKESLDPNTSYGEPYQHNTPLHYAARHAMTRLLRSFLFSKDGNPNKRNIHNENVLHLLCMGPQILMFEGALQPRLYRPYEDEQRRAECIQIVLKWTGAKLDHGEYESANVNATDNNKNTCLHYAAASGMKTCVELLVQRQADLFMENENRETPCDCAEKQHHQELALSLESQMVFSLAPEPEGIEAEYAALDHREMYEGLRPQELRRLKDMLIVETADMLQAPLFTAEALLRAHDWDREKLLEAWMSNAEDCCQRSGVQMPDPPPSGYNAWDTLPSPRTPRTTRSSITSPDEISLTPGDEDSPLCGICMSTISIFEEPIDMSCGHEFCRACWEGFLNLKIQEGEAHNIFCPAYDCFQLVPVEVIESVVSREMDKRYLQFDIKAFVDNNPAIRWCPRAGCERAVRLSIQDPGNSSSDTLSFPLLRAPAVDCGKGHLFCWECQGHPHEPCDCEIWRMWLHRVTEMKPEELAGVSEAYEDAANCLWLLSNSKPCANCKSPIQKNEGCNHMQCAKCKYDFCWICLEEWKKHSSSTGGYYRCTRYEVIQQVEEQAKDMTVEAERKHQSFQELDRFMHYYTRFKNHEHSYQLEQRLLKTAKEKMEQLSRALSRRYGGPPDTTFIEDAVLELLKTRRILKCSYPYGFFLEPKSTKKEIFELMQTDLEMVTEDLAQKVNRPYLRTPRHKIIRAACLVQQKRQEFLASVARGVAPNDSPEAPRRSFAGGTWDWEYLGFASPEEYADFQYRRRHRQSRRGDMFSLRSNTPEPEDPSDSTLDGQDIGGSRRQGTSMGLSSLDEDDPNILLAIQLSLQESGLAMGGENHEFLVNEASLGAIGTSLPSRLDSTPTSMEVPRASLSSSELLELGDSLARLGTLSSHYAVTSSTTAANAQQHCDNLHNLFTFEPPGVILSSSSNTDSAGHDPAANPNLLGNIMAWFHDMNPQSITLVPSSDTDTDLVQTACSSDQGPLLEILNSKPQEELEELANQVGHCPHQVPSEEKETERPTQLDLVDVEALSLALPYIAAELGDDLNISHTDTPKCDSASDLQPSTSSSEWEEQVHLV
ncbi:ankyrin repeat and IBR domain-containing protein 1-like [Hypomesus transpacificus]|uniref:ankyrin repeat and IBR domain-containing protein 1-like n=1 Tax=Hypomesus transpacificus TaxID=137520 RepID=UPI001F07944D|nr:ankyrin repeat and IBR domain-containing protein 1-like [Hypomesus transpacificus]XP_046898656.1 ankyrin repeat and IBR domain-containing protein 1-like [Hypomesus transpacificus]XP_046898665.1 ankyrin repeat and IBR domain-containing protein 1-like [Hypomesus transpacificus]XP_046898671.1 ankyrin repeat and IBR domain-containing protein 1-like [Hypomesus transpacificus]